MEIRYRKADERDIDLLTKTRIEVLRAANHLEESVSMEEVEAESRKGYQEGFLSDSHIAYFAYDGDKVVGTGGVSFYKVLPTYHNPSGRKAYIMNLYTEPDYRRMGIAWQMMRLLVEEARKRKISVITLEATDMGRPLYEKFGFVPMADEMELRSGKW